MPTPNQNLIPDHEMWKFVHKGISASELISFSQNIVDHDNELVDDNLKGQLLSFLDSDPVKAWSDYWVTIMNTTAIGYVSSEDNLLHKTGFTQFIADGGNLAHYYATWGLLFQFPFAQLKHKSFKENGIVINPVVVLIESLVNIFDQTFRNSSEDSFESAYLTIEEIVLRLMKLKSNSSLEVKKCVNEILSNRSISYNYEQDKVQGFETIKNNFITRARLYLQGIDFLKFNSNNSRILIDGWKHLAQCRNFLCFKAQGVEILINENEESQRLLLFEKQFSDFKIEPTELYNKIHSHDTKY